MCGIFGIVARHGHSPSLDDGGVVRLRDLMERRGPDDAGLWRQENAVLAHRRLSVIDPTDAGKQPMATPDERFVIVYNGELYNDAEIRRELLAQSAVTGGFQSSCDTETVLHAFATWGVDAIPRLRGMFAFAVYDRQEMALTLARDPLGIKPLYYHCTGREIRFASDPRALLEHPDVSPRPNLRMVSAYLTTIRTVLGGETLFEDIYALGPGQRAEIHLRGATPETQVIDYWAGPPVEDSDEIEAESVVRSVLEDSVRAHLRADVPTCALLSGGLDSSVTSLLAARDLDDLRTYCAGAIDDASQPIEETDLGCARRVAEFLGSAHAEASIGRDYFASTWPTMIEALGIPLSTPNEVAIYAVASRLREDGCVVTISGEGADELLAGYGPPMQHAWNFEQGSTPELSRGRFQLDSSAWIPVQAKHAILSDSISLTLEEDAWLVSLYESEIDRCAREAGDRAVPLDTHLRFQRRVNLTGLLQRLDTATMLASVEGRTPFADARVAEAFERLPMSSKFEPDDDSIDAGAGGAALATGTRTKVALRRAFARELPGFVVDRPKASFPLPFQKWVADQAPALHSSSFARDLFTTAAIETIAAEPTMHWRLAWPMINIALWGRRWWG